MARSKPDFDDRRTLLTRDEVRRLFRVNNATVDSWRRRGWLHEACTLPSSPPLRPRPQPLFQVHDRQLHQKLRTRLRQDRRPLTFTTLPAHARLHALRSLGRVRGPTAIARRKRRPASQVRGSRAAPVRPRDAATGTDSNAASRPAQLRAEQLAEMVTAAQARDGSKPARPRARPRTTAASLQGKRPLLPRRPPTPAPATDESAVRANTNTTAEPAPHSRRVMPLARADAAPPSSVAPPQAPLDASPAAEHGQAAAVVPEWEPGARPTPRQARASFASRRESPEGGVSMLDEAELESLMEGLPITPTAPSAFEDEEAADATVAGAARWANRPTTQEDPVADTGGVAWQAHAPTAAVLEPAPPLPFAGFSPQSAVMAAIQPNDGVGFSGEPEREPPAEVPPPLTPSEPSRASRAVPESLADALGFGAPVVDDALAAASRWHDSEEHAHSAVSAASAASSADAASAGAAAIPGISAGSVVPLAATEAVGAGSFAPAYATQDANVVADHLHRLEAELKRVERSLADLASRPAASVELQPVLQKIKLEVEMGNAKRDILAGSLTRISDDMKEMRQHLAAASRAAVDYVWDLQRRLDQQVEPPPPKTALSYVRENAAFVASIAVLLVSWALILWMKSGDLRLALGGLLVANVIGCGVILTLRGKSDAARDAAHAES